ncbi:hypothetical protein SUGI_0330360 [Cryptomeria japonica]|nr:hypothetical protein SUGI_0330360 [Cryptomeria japonica]
MSITSRDPQTSDGQIGAKTYTHYTQSISLSRKIATMRRCSQLCVQWDVDAHQVGEGIGGLNRLRDPYQGGCKTSVDALTSRHSKERQKKNFRTRV